MSHLFQRKSLFQAPLKIRLKVQHQRWLQQRKVTFKNRPFHIYKILVTSTNKPETTTQISSTTAEQTPTPEEPTTYELPDTTTLKPVVIEKSTTQGLETSSQIPTEKRSTASVQTSTTQQPTSETPGVTTDITIPMGPTQFTHKSTEATGECLK